MLLIKGNQNIQESSLFFLSARSVLAETVKYKKQSLTEAAEKYLTNEASDFEVLSLLLLGKLPPVKYSPVLESALLSIFKEKIMKAYPMYSQILGENTINSFIHEVDSLYPKLSTQKPVLEFYNSLMEQKSPDEFMRGGGEFKPFFPKTTTGERNQDAWEASINKGETIARGPESEGIIASLKSLISKAGEKGSEWVKSFIDFAKTPEGTTAGATVAATALAALMIYGAYKVYKNFLSKAAQACAGKKGTEKDACMQAYKNKAAQAQMQTLNKVKVACKKSKDPAKCNAIVMAKMQKIRAKMSR